MEAFFIEAHDLLVNAHIVTGAIGLVAFWIPVVGRKGSSAHQQWGRVFACMMLTTGSIAVLISITSLVVPLQTHPKLDDADLVRGIFGWMMMYLGVLTMNLAWYGLACIRYRREHAAHRRWPNILSQAVLSVAAANCLAHGLLLGQVLMVGISFVGFATVATNMAFMLEAAPARQRWLKEHLKGLVGAGISVYTAFFAFGAVRYMPQMALHPGLWAVPLAVGLAIILYHWRDIARKTRGRTAARTVAAE